MRKGAPVSSGNWEKKAALAEGVLAMSHCFSLLHERHGGTKMS